MIVGRKEVAFFTHIIKNNSVFFFTLQVRAEFFLRGSVQLHSLEKEEQLQKKCKEKKFDFALSNSIDLIVNFPGVNFRDLISY